MIEKEVKILNINKREIIQKLKKMGAKKTFEGKIEGVRLNIPYAKLNNHINLLRIRKVGNKTFLAIKGKNYNKIAKVQKEIEVEVGNYNKIKEIFSVLGFKPLRSISKNRTSYVSGKIKFEIDTPWDFPTYLEIEAPSIALIKKAVKILGYNMGDTNNLNYSELIKYYSHKKWQK